MRDGPEREEPIELRCFKEYKVGDIHLFMMTSNRMPDETLYSLSVSIILFFKHPWQKMIIPQSYDV